MAKRRGSLTRGPNSQQKSHPLGWLFVSAAAPFKGGQLLELGWMNVLPGIELSSQGATPQILLPLQRFTTEFEMDRSGSTAPWTPG